MHINYHLSFSKLTFKFPILIFRFCNIKKADNSQEHQRKEHQRELARRLNEDAKDRILNHKGEVTKEKYKLLADSY